MGNLASRDTYGCVLLDILRFLSRPFLQRESAEASQEYASTPAECILHAFHETLDYQGNGLAVNPLFLGNPVYNISLSHIRVLMFVLFLSFRFRAGKIFTTEKRSVPRTRSLPDAVHTI